jgi:hypothetical protein
MNHLSSTNRSGGRQQTDFVPARWWQVIDFIRLNLAVVKGHDPYADRILSRPWSLFSLMEYFYMLVTFPVSDAHFVLVGGERAGVVWTMDKPGIGYILSIGLLPKFRLYGIGLQIAYFLEGYAEHKQAKAAVARIAACNKPVQHMAKAFNGQSLGLATTEMTLSTLPLPAPPLGFGIRRINKSRAAKAWRHWKLHAVEQVSGSIGVQVATDFLNAFGWMDPMPRGKYLDLHQDDREIGLAVARRRGGKMEISLLTSVDLWSGPQTATLLSSISSILKLPVRYLKVTRQHADLFDDFTPFEFERPQEQERHFVFWQYPFTTGRNRYRSRNRRKE